MKNSIIEYNTPDDIKVSIDTEEGFIKCVGNTKNVYEYKYIDMLTKPCSNRAIGIRDSSIFVCFYTNDRNMEVVKLERESIKFQDDIREEHIEILKDKKLVGNINTFMDSGFVVYLQYIDTFDYTGYVIVYVTQGEYIEQFSDQESFITTDMIEFYATEFLTPTLKYSMFYDITFTSKNGKFVRKGLTYETAYECTKMDDIKEYRLLLLKEDYSNIRKMTESLRWLSNKIIEIYSNDDKNEIRSELIRNGFTPLVKYYRMDISYVLNQMDNLYISNVHNLKHMLSLSKHKMEEL